MPALTDRDKKTLRVASVAIAVYLALFFAFSGWKRLEARRNDYLRLFTEAQRLKRELLPYENRVLLSEKLKDALRLDPLKLSRTTLVAEASAAIQKAAMGSGVMLGPIRESAGRPTAKELASMQLEAVGPIAPLMNLLHNMGSLGYPLVLDAIQVNLDPTKPGMVKVNMTVVILDFEQWKKETKPHA